VWLYCAVTSNHQQHDDKNNTQICFSLNKSVTKAEQIPLIEEDSDRSVEVAVAAKAFEK